MRLIKLITLFEMKNYRSFKHELVCLIVLLCFSLHYSSTAQQLKILTPYDYGQVGFGYFPMEFAFDGQPTWDATLQNPVAGGGAKRAPYYSERYGYIDFGPNFSKVRIAEGWTQYRAWSGLKDNSPYTEVWWDDDLDLVNDGIYESVINFNSAPQLVHMRESQWVQDFDFGEAAFTPPARYLLLKSPADMTQRAMEYVLVGYEEEDQVVEDSFVTTWQTDHAGSSSDTQITIPTMGSGYDYLVYWQEVGNTSNMGVAGPYYTDAIIDFETPGTYRLNILGDFPRIYFNNGDDKNKLLTVENWGDIEWASMEAAFYGCENLTVNAADAPNLSSVLTMASMFRGASSFNSSIDDWDVSTVTTFDYMFDSATSFNKPLNSWNMFNARTMTAMFRNAESFDQDLDDWFIYNGYSYAQMFKGATAFNGDVSGWNPVSDQDVDLSEMFSGAVSFNQSVEDWDMASVVDVSRMFYKATSYNQSLDWAFTYGIEDFSEVLYGASAFDHFIRWDISSATSLVGMLDSTALSTENYDITLEYMADDVYGEEIIRRGLVFGAAGLSYSCEGQQHRDFLASVFGWTFTGDVSVCSGAARVGGDLSNTEQDELSKVDITAYPNPSVQTLYVQGGQLEGLELVDLKGRSVYRQHTMTDSGQVKVDVSGIANGVYMLKVITSDQVVVKRIVVKH